MTDSTPPRQSKSAVIRSEFDTILMRHVSSLIDTRDDIAALPFNLATIASLLLIAERENEVKSFPESPPERYTRETFFADLEEIGLELDEDLLVAFQNLERYGFVVVNALSQYTARDSAALLIMVLDSIFPQMPGMNLVAYVIQSIEEVISGRKELAAALIQFDQTLDKQGVRLSAVPEDKLSASATRRIIVPEAPDPEMLRERKAAYLQKLQALRAKSMTTDGSPTVVFGGSNVKHAKITELFPRRESASEAPADHAPLEGMENISAEPSEPDVLSDTEAASPPPGTADAPSLEDTQNLQPSEDALSGTAEGDVDDIEKDSRSAAEDTPAPTEVPGAAIDAEGDNLLPETAPFDVETEPEIQPTSEAEELYSKEDLIEQQIKQFEEELAMPCPICGIGKVLSDTTDKGKIYYHCSNEACRLISWGKPYHMECPLCKNPFLIEAQEPDGQIGLKCPRATCQYRKKAADVLMGEESSPGKKKVLVKRKLKKGVRRVVRRKP